MALGTKQVYRISYGGNQFGPHSEAEIALMVEAGSIGADALIWREGAPNWSPLPASIAAMAPARTLDYAAASTPKRPSYSEIVDAAPAVRRFASAYVVIAFITLAASLILGVLFLATSSRTPFGAMIGIIIIVEGIFGAVILFGMAGVLRMFAGMGLAVRDMARNSFR